LATITDCYLRQGDNESLVDASHNAFEIADKTKNTLILMRIYITLARYYFICRDFTSAQEMLVKAEGLADSSSSIEHQIIIYGLYMQIYRADAEERLFEDAAQKQIITIEKYLEYAGEAYYNDLMNKRGFINQAAEYVRHLRGSKSEKDCEILLKNRNVKMIADAENYLINKKND